MIYNVSKFIKYKFLNLYSKNFNFIIFSIFFIRLLYVFVTNSSADYHLVKDAPIPASSALQVLDGGAKFVLQSGDALKVQSDTASSVDVWVSRVDTISS